MALGIVIGVVIGAGVLWLVMKRKVKELNETAEARVKTLSASARRASTDAADLRIEVKELHRQRQVSEDLILLFPDLIKMIFSGRDSDEVVNYLTRACTNLMKAEEIAIFLADRSGARLGLAASKGLPEAIGRNVNIGLGEGFAGLSAETGRLLDRSEMDKESVLVRRNMIMTDIPGFKPEFAAPMTVEGVLHGVITVGGFHEAGAMRKATLRALAAVGAAALENVRLLEKFGLTSDLDPETGFSGRASLEPTLENELDRVERFGSPLAAMEIVLRNACEETLVSREILVAASRHMRGSLRGIDIGIRTDQCKLIVLLPGTDQKGLDSVTGKLGGELPGLATESGSSVGTVAIRGCVVAGGTRLIPMELLDILQAREEKVFEGHL